MGDRLQNAAVVKVLPTPEDFDLSQLRPVADRIAEEKADNVAAGSPQAHPASAGPSNGQGTADQGSGSVGQTQSYSEALAGKVPQAASSPVPTGQGGAGGANGKAVGYGSQAQPSAPYATGSSWSWEQEQAGLGGLGGSSAPHVASNSGWQPMGGGSGSDYSGAPGFGGAELGQAGLRQDQPSAYSQSGGHQDTGAFYGSQYQQQPQYGQQSSMYASQGMPGQHYQEGAYGSHVAGAYGSSSGQAYGHQQGSAATMQQQHPGFAQNAYSSQAGSAYGSSVQQTQAPMYPSGAPPAYMSQGQMGGNRMGSQMAGSQMGSQMGGQMGSNQMGGQMGSNQVAGGHMYSQMPQPAPGMVTYAYTGTGAGGAGGPAAVSRPVASQLAYMPARTPFVQHVAPLKGFPPPQASTPAWISDYDQASHDVRMMLRSWFDSVDQDRSGEIDAEELERALSSSGDRFSRSSVELMVKIFDADRSMKIDRKEFELLFQYIRAMRESFETYDSQRTGSLTVEEVGHALKMARYDFVEAKTLAVLFQRFDKGARGVLTFENFLEMALYLGNWRTVFAQHDRAKEGTIRLNMEEFIILDMINQESMN